MVGGASQNYASIVQDTVCKQMKRDTPGPAKLRGKIHRKERKWN